MQAKMQEAQQAAADQEFEGTSGGGMVKAVVKGSGEVVSVTFDASVLDPEDPALDGFGAPASNPGRAAEIVLDGRVLGTVGEIHPAVAGAQGIEGRVIAGELDLDLLVADREPWVFREPSSYPPQMFDLAFEVDATIPAGTILTAIDSAGQGLVEKRRIFDVYEGDPIPPGRRSIAINLVVRAPDRTLSDEDVAPIRRSIVESVERATGATLRGEA